MKVVQQTIEKVRFSVTKKQARNTKTDGNGASETINCASISHALQYSARILSPVFDTCHIEFELASIREHKKPLSVVVVVCLVCCCVRESVPRRRNSP